MITKYVYGNPFETDATVLSIDAKKTNPSECKIKTDKNGFAFEKKLDKEIVVYGLGQSIGNINKRGHTYTSYCTDDPSHTENKESLYGAHNFILLHNPKNPTKDIGYFFDYPGKIVFDIGFTDENILLIKCERKDIYVFEIKQDEKNLFKNNSVLDIIHQFRKLIGMSYVPPRWAFGFMQSRWGYWCESDIQKVYDSYKKANIPLDSICLDIDYMKDFKDFTVDSKKFPNLKQFSEKLKNKGVRLVPIIDAGVKIEDGYDVYEEGVKNDYFCKKADGEKFVAGVWPGRTHFPDFLNPAVRQWFGQKYKVLTDMGIEGFWNDMNEPAIFYSEEGVSEAIGKIKEMDLDNLDINSFFKFKDTVLGIANSSADYNRFYHKCIQNGKEVIVKHDDIHNLYGFNMTKSAGEELAKIRPGKRTLLFSRSSYIGMHRYGGIWTGDNCSWWSHLALEIKMMSNLNMCGFLYTGADIGGFGCNANRELVLRWLAFGVFTPLMRNHSAAGTRNQECYNFGDTEDFKAIISVRYKLLPYIYSEYMKAAINDDMYFRPLAIDYPNDERCLEIEDQLMVGESVMVAPVCTENAKGRNVYLPEDMIQIKFLPNDKIEQKNISKGTNYIDVALDEVVIFIKKNCVIPVAKTALTTDAIDYSSLKVIGDIESGATYQLYQDDGYTTEYSLKNLVTIGKQ